MAQKLKKTALMFGQVAGAPPDQEKPTLSGFYGGVGAGQVGAVEDIGKGVQQQTAGLGKVFGDVTVSEGKTPEETKYTLGAGATPFKTSVTHPLLKNFQQTGPVDVTASVDAQGNIVYKNAQGDIMTGGPTSAEIKKAGETATSNISALKQAQSEMEAAQQEASQKASEEAGKTYKEQQDKLTQGQLGQRRAPSELEKQAQDYRNILQTEPGTTNIGAVKSLMQFYNQTTGKPQSFYDTTKYGTLESGLRQGEIALARQQAGTTEQAMETAEGARTGAIAGFKEGVQENYDKLVKAIDQDKAAKLKDIKDYYASAIGKQQTTIDKAKSKAADIEKVENEAAGKKYDAVAAQVTSHPINNIDNVIKAISGRAGDNWLNTRGNEVLAPIRAKMKGLTDQIDQIRQNVALSNQDKITAIGKIKSDMDGLGKEAAGQLAAFLGDTNTHPGDALDAAEQIAAAGLINSLSNDQKNMIRERIKKDKHIEMDDRNKISTPEKLMRIYKAFGGTEQDFM